MSAAEPGPPDLRRELGTLSCVLLVAGNMIGIGIFITAGRIYSVLPHPGGILLAWAFGWFLSVTGALAYAELSSRFPRAGGGYVFLREAFGPLAGFLSGFSSSVVTIPGTAAFLAIGFTRYAGIENPAAAKLVAVGLILSISFVNYRGVKWGAELQDGFMLVKLALIAALIILGFSSGNGHWENFRQAGTLVRPWWIAFPLVMVPVMYTYSGWDATVYVAGEVRNPTRTIPTSLFLGTLLVGGVYILMACLYFYAIPVTAELKGARIVTAAAQIFFGGRIGDVVGRLIALSVLGCLSAHILTGPRVIFAMARDGLFLFNTGEVHPLFATPGRAIAFHAIGASFLVWTGTFDQLLDYVTVPSVLFAALAVVGLFRLRRAGRSDPGSKPYLAWGYPVLPALFILGMAWIVAVTVAKQPLDSLRGLGIVSLGFPFYFLLRARTPPRS